MSEYIVSARKYRPARFADMVGQEHISSTLQNALQSGHLAHAFLFCGPRGVGKTTAARILAKTINCENLSATFEACNECSSCQSFNHNASFNIHELDAASNNSVEDIRALVEQVRFAPQSGKYKIYIIDEVHMLSQAAFNAFLKTLEEPPSYCKFILATTEKHKILPTILSRCQVFDFRRIGIETIVKHLKNICKLENIEAEEDALHVIAQKSDGGMRDALSMFDRLSSFAGGKLTYQSVLENLNVLDFDYFFKVTDSLLAEDIQGLFVYLDEILKRGFEGDDFILGLCEHFRNLLFCKNPETLSLMESSENIKERYKAQTQLASSSFLINCLHIGNQMDVQYKASKNKRLTVELALTRMCYINQTIEAQQEASKKKLINSATEKVEIVTQKQSVIQASERQTAIKPASPDKSNIIKRSAKIQHLDDIDTSSKNSFIREDKEIYQPSAENKTENSPKLFQELLNILWEEYSHKISETKGGLSSLMSVISPTLENGNIAIVVESNLQKETFSASLQQIKNYICSKSTFDGEIQCHLTAQTDNNVTKKYYSPGDKLRRLIELYPAIKKLQKDLALDADYE